MTQPVPRWLREPPDQMVDHRYLTQAEVDSLPDGVFYKKKAALTRHRFAKATVDTPSGPVRVEVVDNRGCWRIEPRELDRLATAFRQPDLPVDGDSDAWAISVLEAASLFPHILPSSVPPSEPIAVEKPQTTTDILRLYRDYTDMAEQGHFADDSPDLDRLHLMLDWVPDCSAVLDIGCNSGTFGEHLLPRSCQVTGVDVAPSLLRRAQARGTMVVLALAEALPFRTDTFDVVLCGEILEHSLSPKRLLAEARRVLTTDGLLVGSVPHGLGEWGHNDLDFHPEHLWAWNPQELSEFLADTGFALLRLVEQRFGNEIPDGIVFSARPAG